MAHDAGAEHRLALADDLAGIAEMNDWLLRLDAARSLGDALAGDLRLCLNEWVVNVMSYGFAGTPAPRIAIALRFRPGYATAEVRDNGQPFDPTLAPDAPPMTDLESAPIGGFGITLMRKSSAMLSYRREDTENVVTMTFGAPG